MKARARNGQILILTALMSTTLIIMFGMVVSIGHLIQARVNLQNAVDFAALSGASWQARYLNMLSLVNYRMRQNYKFILYDLYVTQSRFNTSFITQIKNNAAVAKNDMLSKSQTGSLFSICQQAYNYQPIGAVGETGTGADAQTNMCQNLGSSIPPVNPIPPLVPEPTLLAIYASMQSLSQAMQDICKNSAGQNLAYFRYIIQHLNGRQSKQISEMLKVLKDFNQAFTDTGMISGAGDADQTIFRTFYSNLLGANQNAQIEYINPAEARRPSLASLNQYFNDTTASFAVPVADFRNSGGCQITAIQRTSLQAAPGTGGQIRLGMSRVRKGGIGQFGPPVIPYQIVVKATVQPDILFWPRGLTPTLVAVSAAKPFGSRVGPTQDQSNFEIFGTTTYPLPMGLANMSFYPGDVDAYDGILPGVGHKYILRRFFEALSNYYGYQNGWNPARGVNGARPSISGFSPVMCSSGNPHPLCFALAPTLYESLFFNTYPFPANYKEQTVGGLSDSLAIASMFPWEYLQKQQASTSDEYRLVDREPYNNVYASSEAMNLWHTTSLMGNSPIFENSQGKALFFGDNNSTLSSWSPNYVPPGYNGGPVPELQSPGGDRLGYQIKLLSLQEACQELSDGGGVAPGGVLNAYCQSDPGFGVFL